MGSAAKDAKSTHVDFRVSRKGGTTKKISPLRTQEEKKGGNSEAKTQRYRSSNNPHAESRQVSRIPNRRSSRREESAGKRLGGVEGGGSGGGGG